jgi:two-component system KDP operon response regulator KdpE
MSEPFGTVLVVDDDAAIRHALATTLTGLGFAVKPVSSGEDAVATVRSQPFDAALLDISMPGMGGLEACRKIRSLFPALPILMLTVLDSQNDIVEAFSAGADDYVTKPFEIRELTARLRRAVLRSRTTDLAGRAYTAGEIELDPSRRTVKRNGQLLHLTPKEFDLLHYLMENAGMPVTHIKLLRAIWGPEYGGELEYLRVFIRQLRLKIEADPARPSYILTEPFVGYRFCETLPATSNVADRAEG